MIRPSALQLARDCRYSAELGERFPESSEAAEDGTDLHAQVRSILEGKLKTDCAGERAIIVSGAMLSRLSDADVVSHETKVSIADPDTDETIIEGTADCVAEKGGIVTIYDYKFGRLANVPHPDDNWQMKAYGAAVAIARGMQGFIPVIVGEEDGVAVFIQGKFVSNVSEIIDEIRTVNARQSSPILGQHCSRCYRTKYCHAYQAQTKAALVIVDNASEVALDDETVALLSQRIDQVEDALKAAKAIRRDYIARGGRVVVDGKVAKLTTQQGRESANVAALKADGLEIYVKRGEPFEKITWVKPKLSGA